MMSNQDLLKIILEDIKTKFTKASEKCSASFVETKNLIQYSNDIGNLEAYGNMLSYISELYTLSNLGLLEATYGTKGRS